MDKNELQLTINSLLDIIRKMDKTVLQKNLDDSICERLGRITQQVIILHNDLVEMRDEE